MQQLLWRLLLPTQWQVSASHFLRSGKYLLAAADIAVMVIVGLFYTFPPFQPGLDLRCPTWGQPFYPTS